MSTTLNWLAAFCAAVVAAESTRGSTLFVDDDAPADPGPGDCAVSDHQEDGSIDHPWDCIGEAIADAVDRDEIIVAPGTYFEAIDFGGKAITLRSSDGLEVTTIDATGLGMTAVQFVNGEGEDTVLDGFTITGAEGTRGGGVLISFTSPTLRNLKFYQNMATIRGGGLYSDHGHFTMIDCEFRENESCLGGAISLDWGQATLIGTLIVDNSASNYGGGIHCSHSSPLMVDCRLQRNDGFDDGNAMFVRSGSDPMILNCIFKQNRGRGDGGGIAVFDACMPTIVDCLFDGNKTWNGHFNTGAGILAHGLGADPIVIDSVFIRNGVLNGDEDKGAALWSSHEASPLVVGCDFIDNFADWGAGAGAENATPTYIDCTFQKNTADLGAAIYSGVGAAVTALNCEFSSNHADRGGAVWESLSGPSAFTNCLFAHNRAILGAAVYGENGAAQTLTNVTMAHNIADRGAAVFVDANAGATIANAILWGNRSRVGHSAIWDAGFVEVSHALVENGWPGGVATFHADPMFAGNALSLDNRRALRLRHGSRAIDAGNNAALPADVTDIDNDGDTVEPLPVDLAGRRRVLGLAVDLGPFEHSPRAPDPEGPTLSPVQVLDR